jgi:4-amino-4-deoxy-L-arabinose transferase-like glycosyltransferase
MDERRRQAWLGGALLAIVLLGAYLRIESLDAAPLWFDERDTDRIVHNAHSVEEVLANKQTRNFEHPPGYFLLAYATVHVVDRPFAVRWPAAAAGVLGILTTFALAKRTFGHRAGLIAALLVAVASYHIAYSQDARFYSLLYLTCSVCWLALFRFLERGTWADSVAVAVSVALAVWTHRVVFALAVGMFAYAAATIALDPALRARRNALLQRLSAAAVLALLFSLPELLNSYTYTKTQIDESGHSLQLSAATTMAVVRRWGSGMPHGMVYVFSALAVAGVVYGMAARGPRSLYLVIWLLATPLFFAAIPFDKFFDLRFIMPSYPAFLILVAAGIEALAAARGRYAGAGQVLAVVVTVAIVSSFLYKDVILRRLPLRCSEFYWHAELLDIENGFCRNEMLLNTLIAEHEFMTADAPPP